MKLAMWPIIYYENFYLYVKFMNITLVAHMWVCMCVYVWV